MQTKNTVIRRIYAASFILVMVLFGFSLRDLYELSLTAEQFRHIRELQVQQMERLSNIEWSFAEIELTLLSTPKGFQTIAEVIHAKRKQINATGAAFIAATPPNKIQPFRQWNTLQAEYWSSLEQMMSLPASSYNNDKFSALKKKHAQQRAELEEWLHREKEISYQGLQEKIASLAEMMSRLHIQIALIFGAITTSLISWIAYSLFWLCRGTVARKFSETQHSTKNSDERILDQRMIAFKMISTPGSA